MLRSKIFCTSFYQPSDAKGTGLTDCAAYCSMAKMCGCPALSLLVQSKGHHASRTDDSYSIDISG